MVYYVKMKGWEFVKIGLAKDPHKRFSALQTSNPFELELIHYHEGDREDEKRLHERYKIYRHRGEWFNVKGDLKTFVNNVMRKSFYNFLMDYIDDDDYLGDLANDVKDDYMFSYGATYLEIYKRLKLKGAPKEAIMGLWWGRCMFLKEKNKNNTIS